MLRYTAKMLAVFLCLVTPSAWGVTLEAARHAAAAWTPPPLVGPRDLVDSKALAGSLSKHDDERSTDLWRRAKPEEARVLAEGVDPRTDRRQAAVVAALVNQALLDPALPASTPYKDLRQTGRDEPPARSADRDPIEARIWRNRSLFDRVWPGVLRAVAEMSAGIAQEQHGVRGYGFTWGERGSVFVEAHTGRVRSAYWATEAVATQAVDRLDPAKHGAEWLARRGISTTTLVCRRADRLKVLDQPGALLVEWGRQTASGAWLPVLLNLRLTEHGLLSSFLWVEMPLQVTTEPKLSRAQAVARVRALDRSLRTESKAELLVWRDAKDATKQRLFWDLEFSDGPSAVARVDALDGTILLLSHGDAKGPPAAAARPFQTPALAVIAALVALPLGLTALRRRRRPVRA